MTHQYKVGDRVRLKADQFDYAAANKISGEQTIKAIDGAIAIFENGQSAFLFRLEPAPPAPPAPAPPAPAKSYRTRGGRAVRIYATDGFGDWQAVHGAVKEGDKWDVEFWFADGRGSDSSLDLIEVKPEREVWLVWRRSEGYDYFMTYREKPASSECPNAVAMKLVKLSEGEGL